MKYRLRVFNGSRTWSYKCTETTVVSLDTVLDLGSPIQQKYRSDVAATAACGRASYVAPVEGLLTFLSTWTIDYPFKNKFYINTNIVRYETCSVRTDSDVLVDANRNKYKKQTKVSVTKTYRKPSTHGSWSVFFDDVPVNDPNDWFTAKCILSACNSNFVELATRLEFSDLI